MFEFDEADGKKDEQQSVALKIALPERLYNDLSLFATYAGVSKSEFSRTAFTEYLNSLPVWKARSYFFQPNDKVKNSGQLSIEDKLKLASKGSLIKVAALQVDAPDRANIMVGNLVRIKGRDVSFDIPSNFRPTHMVNNILDDVNNVKMVAGKLVIPLIDNVMILGMPTQRFIYTVDIDYIWDVDTNTPAF
ncbi:hypothetical protein ACOII5_001791 [Cronobacter dublinensis]